MLYGYSLRDNLTSATDQLDPAEDVGYGYDPRQMLESATGPWGTLAWAYDPVGNRASQTLTPPGGGAATDTYSYALASNRLTQILGPGASRSFGQDGAGNTIAEARVAGVTENWTYSYDTNGRMVTATVNGKAEGENSFPTTGFGPVSLCAGSAESLHSRVGITQVKSE